MPLQYSFPWTRKGEYENPKTNERETEKGKTNIRNRTERQKQERTFLKTGKQVLKTGTELHAERQNSDKIQECVEKRECVGLLKFVKTGWMGQLGIKFEKISQLAYLLL